MTYFMVASIRRHFTAYCDECKCELVPRFYTTDDLAPEVCQESFEASEHLNDGVFVRIYCDETKEYIRVQIRKRGGIALRDPQVFKGTYDTWR